MNTEGLIKRYVVVLMALSFVSCTYFENKFKKEPIQVIDTIVDFSTVDSYPLFPECADIPSREKQVQCFQITMAKYIYAELSKFEFAARDSITETIELHLTVNSVGRTEISGLNIDQELIASLPGLDSVIRKSVEQLPVIEPAIKRGIPVTTSYTLPIILKN